MKEKSRSDPVIMVSLIRKVVVTKLSINGIRYFLQVIWVGLLFIMQEGWTALHYAADRGHVNVLHILLMVKQCHVTVLNKVSKPHTLS